MSKSNSEITIKGKPIEVGGRIVKEGDIFPLFKLTDNDMSDLTNEKFKNKILVVAAVPSLDTAVCSTEARTFNEEITKISPDVVVLTVSRDLPFAQKRWCAAEGVDHVITASDYKYRTFADATGTLWKDAELLIRAVFVVDKTGKTTYVEYVPEIAQEPSYEAVAAAVKAVL